MFRTPWPTGSAMGYTESTAIGRNSARTVSSVVVIVSVVAVNVMCLLYSKAYISTCRQSLPLYSVMDVAWCRLYKEPPGMFPIEG